MTSYYVDSSGSTTVHSQETVTSINNISRRFMLTSSSSYTSWSLTVSPDSSILLYKVKLERGNIVTDWTPNPEDLEIVVDGVSDRVTEVTETASDAQSKIANLNERYESEISNAQTGLISRVGVISATVDDISINVSDTTSDLANYNSYFSFEGTGLKISTVKTAGVNTLQSSAGYYIHLRYFDTAISGTSAVGMRSKPTNSSQFIGFQLSSSNVGSTKPSDYTLLAMNSDSYVSLTYNQTTYYFWKFYAETDTPTNVSSTDNTGRNYLGLVSRTDTTTPDYNSVSSWVLFRDIKNPISTAYTSDGMKFLSNETYVVGSVSSDGFYLSNGIISEGGTFRMGNYLWTPLSDGSLSLIYDPIN